MEKDIYFNNSQNEKLSGVLHEPTTPNNKGIILSHCFTCSKHQGILRKICENLTNAGYLVLRFDFSGNGESEGNFEDSTYSKEMSDLGIEVWR